MKTYECEIEIRGYELDSFGHVNHACYVSYCEHARWKLLEQEEISLETFKQWQQWPVIAKLEFNYLKPTYLGDTLKVFTKILQIGKTYVQFSHELMNPKLNTLVCQAKVTVAFVDAQGKLVRIHDKIEKLGQ